MIEAVCRVFTRGFRLGLGSGGRSEEPRRGVARPVLQGDIDAAHAEIKGAAAQIHVP